MAKKPLRYQNVGKKGGAKAIRQQLVTDGIDKNLSKIWLKFQVWKEKTFWIKCLFGNVARKWYKQSSQKKISNFSEKVPSHCSKYHAPNHANFTTDLQLFPIYHSRLQWNIERVLKIEQLPLIATERGKTQKQTKQLKTGLQFLSSSGLKHILSNSSMFF